MPNLYNDASIQVVFQKQGVRGNEPFANKEF